MHKETFLSTKVLVSSNSNKPFLQNSCSRNILWTSSTTTSTQQVERVSVFFPSPLTQSLQITQMIIKRCLLGLKYFKTIDVFRRNSLKDTILKTFLVPAFNENYGLLVAASAISRAFSLQGPRRHSGQSICSSRSSTLRGATLNNSYMER